MRLSGLISRTDLNERCGIIVGPFENDRWPLCILGSVPLIGVNVRESNIERLVTSIAVRLQAWNDLSSGYFQEGLFTKAMDALYRGIDLVSTEDCDENEDRERIKSELCTTFSNMSWLCMAINKKNPGFEFNGDTVNTIMEWAMRTIFTEVIANLPKDAKLAFGAGRLPDHGDKLHLILTVVEGENGDPRYFVVDESNQSIFEFAPKNESVE